MRWFAPLFCLVVFHTPDGKPLTVDTRHIVALKPAHNLKGHVAEGTNTVVYLTAQNFGVTETREQIEHLIHTCSDYGSEL